jgi:S-adenosylmethionine:tRNA ribosyltransferase-isomerase
MRTDLFQFDLPDDLIALYPADRRDASRLLHVCPDNQSDSGGSTLRDLKFKDLPSLVRPGDAMVFNDTAVIPALLKGERQRQGSTIAVSVNLLSPIDAVTWRALARPGRRLRVGDRLLFARPRKANEPEPSETLAGEVVALGGSGQIDIAFDVAGEALLSALELVGLMPLPHYIASRRSPDDTDRASYQTVFAKERGAVAAPTAGLHFTDALLDTIKQHGVSLHHVTLHVGGGTFLPVKANDTDDHQMHAEWGCLTAKTADALNTVRAKGGRIVAVGTTSLRLLETAADVDGRLQAFTGDTDIFITPGYRFKAVDALVTNFHLPGSTLFMLVSAFSGLDNMKAAYAHAVDQKYRFYSYGDACFLEPSKPQPVRAPSQTDPQT